MSKGKKLLLNIVYSIIGVILLAAALFHFLVPGVPLEKIGEDGSKVAYLAFPNGDYTGESLLTFLDGKGTFTFNSGEVYEGEWKNNGMSGSGKLTSTAGTYEGEFEKSLRCGTGTFLWSDGSKYVGQWANDMLNGEGELTTADGMTYKGTFLDNALHTGNISGVYKNNQFSIAIEEGVLAKEISVTFADGVTYTGGFAGRKFSGKGEMTFPGVGKYDGSFKEGQRSGEGIFTWEDGASYDGKWYEDVFSGNGTYNFDSVTSISGSFKEGILDGTYTYKNADGEYKTVWEDGKCTSVKVK